MFEGGFVMYNGNRTEWSPIRSVIVGVIDKINRMTAKGETELDDMISCYQL